jgi:hypothetical protein
MQLKRRTMHLPALLAKQIRDLYFGGNWCCVNVLDTLSGIDWKQAAIQVHGLNSIATLVYHTGYYISAQSEVLQGRPLNAKDSLSFEHPPLTSADDWQALLDKTFTEAEAYAALVEAMPEAQLPETFSAAEYGNYYRNIQGVIEHMHYHLGQMVIIRKMLPQPEGEAWVS